MKIIRREISQEELERAKQWKGPGHNAKVSVQKLEDGVSQAGGADAKKTVNEGWDDRAAYVDISEEGANKANTRTNTYQLKNAVITETYEVDEDSAASEVDKQWERDVLQKEWSDAIAREGASIWDATSEHHLNVKQSDIREDVLDWSDLDRMKEAYDRIAGGITDDENLDEEEKVLRQKNLQETYIQTMQKRVIKAIDDHLENAAEELKKDVSLSKDAKDIHGELRDLWLGWESGIHQDPAKYFDTDALKELLQKAVDANRAMYG